MAWRIGVSHGSGTVVMVPCTLHSASGVDLRTIEKDGKRLLP